MASKPGILLLVEDDPDILEEVAHYLRRRNFQVITAPDYKSGMQALANEALRFDVLLTDVKLGDGDGIDLLAYVNQSRGLPKPRVILITGHLDRGNVSQALSDGAEAVLLKPFSLGALLELLRRGAEADNAVTQSSAPCVQCSSSDGAKTKYGADSTLTIGMHT
jgi:DNA-binding NtrC family response regulator